MKVLFRFPLYFSISVLLELHQFVSIGIRYPYPNISVLWWLKHGVVALVLAVLYKVDGIAHTRRRLLAYFGIAVLATVLIHLDYPHTKFCGIWCGDLAPLGIPFVFLGCVLETTVFLFLAGYLQKNRTRLSPLLYGALVLVPVYYLWRPGYLEKLNKKYPVTWVFEQSYNSTSFSYMSITHPRADEVLKDFEKLAAQISRKDWLQLCTQFGFLSFNSPYFGKSHAESCHYYAAIIYRDRSLCEKMVQSHRPDCEKDVNTLQQITSQKKTGTESFHGIPVEREPVEPFIRFHSYRFAHGPNDKPFIALVNPTDQVATLDDVELMGGLTPRVIKKLSKLSLKPGEIQKISLVDQKAVLRELGFGEDFLMLTLQSQGKVIQSVHNRILMPRYKNLCLKSWNLDPWSKNPLFIELYNFSKGPVDAERTEVFVLGFNEYLTESALIAPRQSRKMDLEKIRVRLKEHVEKDRPTQILKMSLIVNVMGSGETVAATGSMDQVVDFCASPKQYQ